MLGYNHIFNYSNSAASYKSMETTRKLGKRGKRLLPTKRTRWKQFSSSNFSRRRYGGSIFFPWNGANFLREREEKTQPPPEKQNKTKTNKKRNETKPISVGLVVRLWHCADDSWLTPTPVAVNSEPHSTCEMNPVKPVAANGTAGRVREIRATEQNQNKSATPTRCLLGYLWLSLCYARCLLVVVVVVVVVAFQSRH